MRYLILFLLLASCGPAEKKDIGFGKDDGKQGACTAPSFFRGDAPGITDPAQLPRGYYRFQSVQVFFREEEGELRAHFLEGQRGNEFVSRKICASALPERVLLSIPFEGFSEFSIGETVTFRPFTAMILGEKEKISFSRTAPGAPVNESLTAVLSKWSHWAFYKVNDSEYELRLYVFETHDGRLLMKMMILAFSFSPAT